MIALNIVLIAVVVLAIVGLLARAIIRDRRSKRTSGGAVHPSEAPLHHNLMMPREVRTRHMVRIPTRRKRGTGSPTG
jgi:hypothetical protein